MDLHWQVPTSKKQCSPSSIHVHGGSPSGTKFRNLLPKNSLPVPSRANAESKSPPWTLSVKTTNVSHSSINMLPTTPASLPVFTAASQSATVIPSVQLFGSPTPQISTTTTLNNLVCLNPGIPQVINTTNVSLLNNGTSSPVIVPGSSNFMVTTMSNTMPEEVVCIAGPSHPSYTPQNSFVPVPVQAVSVDIPSTTVPQKFIVTSPSMGTTSPSPSSNSGSPSASEQPRNLIAKINTALNEKVPLHKIVKVFPLSRGTESSQNATPSFGKYTEANETDNRSKRPPLTAPKPFLLKNVIMPKVQPDGTVRMEKTVVLTKETDDENLPKENKFIVSEVSNNPSETGVAKKFVVFPAYTTVSAPVSQLSSTVAFPQKTIEATDSSAANTSLSKHFRISRVNHYECESVKVTTLTNSPASSLVSTEQCYDDLQIRVDSTSGSGERWSWHHPYLGEPPSLAEERNTTEDSVNVNAPVNISSDDDDVDEQPAHKTSSATPAAEVTDAVDDPVFIPGDDKKPALELSSQPIDGVPDKDSECMSPPNYDARLDEEKSCRPVSCMYEYTTSYDQECSKTKTESPNLSCTPFELHQPCANVVNAGERSGMSKDSGTRTQPQNTELKFNVEHYIKRDEFSTNVNLNMGNITPEKCKKNKILRKKKRRAQFRKKVSESDSSSMLDVPSLISGTSLPLIDQIDEVDRKSEIKCVPTTSQPVSPSENINPFSVGASISSSERSSFKWHHPCTENFHGKPKEESGVAWHLELKIEPTSLSGVENEHAEVPLPLGSEPNPRDTRDITDQKCSSVSFAGEPKTENDKNMPRIDPGSIHSVSLMENVKPSACHTDQFVTSVVFDDELEGICSVENVPARAATPGLRSKQKERPDKKQNKLLVNLKRKLKTKTEGANSSSASKLKKVTAGGIDKERIRARENRKIQKIVKMTSSSGSNPGKEIYLSSSPDRRDSPNDKIFEPSVLRDCIVRKAIQDCYSEGLIPTVDRIHNVCCASGLESQKHSVEPHLISIGYNWVKCNSGRLPVEDHRVTTGRIKYLKKLEKYKDRNFVYIFVSEYVKKTDAGWELIVEKNGADRSCLDSACVVLHAMSNKSLLECSLKVLKMGLFGLKRKDIVSWLKCKVIPNIPKGSVVILGNHSVFDKNEESEERPNVSYSKEKIVSWLTDHKVTSVNPALPKAILLSQVDHVILPKTCVFDRLIRQNGLVPLHLPKHHKDLNPVEFLWREILDKLHKSEEGFEDFVAREFSASSQAASSVACNLVRRFERSYREFDWCFDEFYEKAVAASDAAQVCNGTQGTAGQPENPASPDCPICLRQMKMLGFRCYSCRSFWRRLVRNFKQSPSSLPVCRNKKHISTRPPNCEGCRRFRYERVQLQSAYAKTKGFILPIPPVTKEGKRIHPT